MSGPVVRPPWGCLPVVVRREITVDGWVGAVPRTGAYLTDGHLMVRAADVEPELRGALTRRERPMPNDVDRAEKAERLWNAAVHRATRRATYVDRGPHKGADSLFFRLAATGQATEDPLILDVEILALAEAVVGPPEEIRGETSTTAAVAYRAGVPVAVIMPRRP